MSEDTVVNSPNGGGTSGGAGVVIGAALVLLVLVAVIAYSLPYIREQFEAMSNPGTPVINVQLPSQPNPPAPTGTSTPQ